MMWINPVFHYVNREKLPNQNQYYFKNIFNVLHIYQKNNNIEERNLFR